MARRTLNRLELRRVSEAADAAGDSPKDNSDDAVAPAPKKAVKPKSTKPRARKAAKAPVRMRVRWAVVNDSLKQVAVFDYANRTDADKKVADLMDKGKGHHFVRIVKEPMPELAAVV